MTVATPDASNNTRIEVLHNTENIVNAYLQIFRNSKSKWDYYADVKAVIFAIDTIEKALIDTKARGIKSRFITEITKDNFHHCKEVIMKIGELRHLDGVKGNFGVSDTEYIATSTMMESQIESAAQATPATTKATTTALPSHAVYSNVKEDIQQHQYLFNTLWNKGTPAQQKIREIEEGTAHYETKILDNPEEIVREIGRLTASSNELSNCLTPGGMQYSYNHFFEIKKKLLDKQKKGGHKGIRYISNINKDNAKLARIFLDAGIEIRHIKNLPPMSFGVSDKEIAATIEKMEGGEMVQSLLLSNEAPYVSHFHSIFEELWNNGIDASDRLSDINEGADLADIEVIQSSSRARVLYLDLVRSAREELLLVFATTGAFTRQKKMGVIELCIEAAKDRNVKVRILMPAHESSEQTVKNLRQNYPEQINIRYIEQTSGTKATILLVDRRFSLVMELRDDSKGTFDNAIGLSTYSNSRSGVLSYVSIFENLWIQTELYAQVKQANEQLASANERLKLHDKMQQEFINVAAHELRTPVQPILSIVGVLRSTKGNIDRDKLDNSIDLIDRNAKRLKRLTEDLLDATKIESQSLKLNKEVLNLDELISSAIQDTKNQIENRSVRVRYEPKNEDIIFLEADRHRVVQVVTNLLSNAVKFTKGHGGTVSISTEKKKGNDDDNLEVALVCVKDNGSGIDCDIFPRLFEKFATKSFQGTGLGLFICKGIVNAHHGKIWAENNADGEGKGATFYFTLPIVKDSPGAITKK